MRWLVVALVVLAIAGCYEYPSYGGGHFRGPSAEHRHEPVTEEMREAEGDPVERGHTGLGMRFDLEDGSVSPMYRGGGVGINLYTGNLSLDLGGGMMMDLSDGSIGLGFGF